MEKPANFCFYCVIALLILCSCQRNPKEKIQEELHKWKEKEIYFPNEMVFTKFGKDTVEYEYQKRHKILVYIDSKGCTPCKLKLSSWETLKKEWGYVSQNKIAFIFYFADKNPKEIETILRAENFDFPVVVDEKNQLNQLNKFSTNENFHYFLLDKQNRIKIIGNPIYNTKIKELYFSEIQKE